MTDTGHGMDDATKAHIFEPFFTTKEVGKGTGLGLATVYGVVKQSGGFIWVDSSPGTGTTFEIYLPQAAGLAEKAEADEKPAVILRAPRQFSSSRTKPACANWPASSCASRVITYWKPKGDSRRWPSPSRHPGVIHLLLSDMVMPRMSGGELATQLKAIRPAMRVAFMSGYSEFSRGDLARDFPEAPVLQKPFSPASLVEIVREALARPLAAAPREDKELHVT